MRRLVPGIYELAILGALALACGTVIACFGTRQGPMLTCGFILLLVSMLLGARRAGHLSTPAAISKLDAPQESSVSASN